MTKSLTADVAVAEHTVACRGRVVYCADLAGNGGGRRHLQAVERVLRNLGWNVDHVPGVLGFLRKARSTGGGETSSRLAAVAASVVLVANSVLVAISLGIRVRRNRPDVLLWRPGLFQFHGLLAARWARVPLVLEVNAPLAEEATEHGNYAFLGLAARIERRLIRAADRIVAVSEANARFLDRPGQVEVVPNGGGYLDLAEADSARRWGREHCPMCVTREQAPFAVLLETFRGWHGDEERRAAVRAVPEGWKVLVIGDGPGRAAFLEWVRETGLASKVVSLGVLEPEAVQHLLSVHANLGLVLYPPLERFYFSPLKLYDFLAHDLPVVATDLGQVGAVGREVPDRVHLVAPGDLEAIAQTVAWACAVGGRPPSGSETVTCSPYGWPAAVAAYARVLTAAIRRSSTC